MMPRIFSDAQVTVGGKLQVGGDDGHHFARVLRAKPGEQMTVAAAGTGYLATISAVDKQAGMIELLIAEKLPPRDPRHAVYVVQALAKADKVDTVIQKCTEVGVAGVLLYESNRSVVKLKQDKVMSKVERWRKVAREAAVQCQRDTIPAVQYASAFTEVLDWIHQLEKCTLLLLDEGESVLGLRTALGQTEAAADMAAVVVAGPEGGWSDEERSRWLHDARAKSVTLGPRILRTETAGVAAVTAILYEFGDLGG